MAAKTYEFEGEHLTVAEIRKRVPALSDGTIRKHLAEGRNTRQAMLTFNVGAAIKAGARKGRKRSTLFTSVNPEKAARRMGERREG